MPDHTSLVDRIARAAQDCRTVWGETTTTTLPNGATVSETPILHSAGPQSRAELDAAREAVQMEANRLVAEGDDDAAWLLLVLTAETERAGYAQYRGHWNAHTLTVATRRERFKGGRTVERGDALLREADADEYGFVGCYSARMGGDVCVAAAKVRA